MIILTLTLTQLPIDLITDILSRLPAKTLLCLKIVCKSWYNLISDNNFFVNYHLERSLATKTNLHYVVTIPRFHLLKNDHFGQPSKKNCPVLYSVDFDSFDNPIELNHPLKNGKTRVEVIGSCRGLLLLRFDDGHLLLYNPTTQTYIVLLFLPVSKSVRFCTRYIFGFGYDSISRDWKCVRIMQLLNQDTGFFRCEVMVYSLKGNCWKRVLDIPCYFDPRDCIGALVHEMYHWSGTNIDVEFEVIVAFSLRDETFSCLSLPSFQFESDDDLYVGNLDCCLCLLANSYTECNVWIMKEYGVAESWTRMFSIEIRGWENFVRPVRFSMENKNLFVQMSPQMLAYIDLQTMEVTHVMFADWDKGLDAHVYVENAHVYVENLLMLDRAEPADGICIRKKHGKRKNKKRRRRSNN